MKTMIQMNEPLSLGGMIPFAEPKPAPPATTGNNQPEALLTERQVCAYLKVSKRNLYCWRMAGLIPYYKIGRAVRYRLSAVDRALESMNFGILTR